MAIIGAAGAFAKATATGAFTKATAGARTAGRVLGVRTPKLDQDMYKYNEFSLDSYRVARYGLAGGAFTIYKTGDNHRKRRGRAS